MSECENIRQGTNAEVNQSAGFMRTEVITNLKSIQ